MAKTSLVEREARLGRFSWRRLGKRLGFALLAMAVFLVALDSGVGCYFRGTPEGSLMRNDPDLFYRLRPGEDARVRIGRNTPAEWSADAPSVRITINEDGYRGPRVDRVKAPGEYRILCLGDSITMGVDVANDETYPALLERALRERYPGRTITVINGGVLGYSSRQGLYLFKDKFLAYEPDLVIWGYGFNDQSRMSVLDHADVSLVPMGPGEKAAGATWKRRAVFWAFSRPTAQVVRLLVMPLVWRTAAAGLMQQIQDLDHAAGFKLTADDFIKSRVPPRDYEVHLLEMDNLARSRHFRWMIVSFWATAEPYRDSARRFGEAHHTPWLDFTPAFARILQTRSLAENPSYEKIFSDRYRPFLQPGTLDAQPMFYLTTDNLHPNAIGQQIIAATLAQALEPIPEPGP